MIYHGATSPAWLSYTTGCPGIQYVVQAGLKPPNLSTSECWDYKHPLPFLLSECLLCLSFAMRAVLQVKPRLAHTRLVLTTEPHSSPNLFSYLRKTTNLAEWSYGPAVRNTRCPCQGQFLEPTVGGSQRKVCNSSSRVVGCPLLFSVSTACKHTNLHTDHTHKIGA